MKSSITALCIATGLMVSSLSFAATPAAPNAMSSATGTSDSVTTPAKKTVKKHAVKKHAAKKVVVKPTAAQ